MLFRSLGKEVKHLELFDKKDNLSFPFVVKDPTSKGGKDVFLVESKEELENIYSENMILQRFLPNADDIRTYIIGNEIIMSLKRVSNSGFKANYKINHKAEIYNLNEDELNLIKTVLNKFQFDYVGIDILKNESTGEFYFSEIEDSVGARAVYDISDIDIIGMYVEYIVKQLN